MEGHRKQLEVFPNTDTSVTHTILTNPKEVDVYALSSISRSNDRSNAG